MEAKKMTSGRGRKRPKMVGTVSGRTAEKCWGCGTGENSVILPHVDAEREVAETVSCTLGGMCRLCREGGPGSPKRW